MIKKILEHKAYLFIGTLLTAGVVVGITYNSIIASSQTNQNVSVSRLESNTQQTQDFENIKNTITGMQSKIEELETKVATLEDENSSKTNTIEGLQSKVNSLERKAKTKDTQISSLKEQVKSVEENSDTAKIKDVEDELQRTKQTIETRNKRISEIQIRLNELSKLPQDHLTYEKAINQIRQSLEEETNPLRIKELQSNLESFQERYEKAKKVDEEIAQLREEMKTLLSEEL